MSQPAQPSTIRERVIATLEDRKPDRMPFIDRLEIWHKSQVRAGTLPAEYRDLSLTDIHRRLGMGQQKFVPAHALRLHGAELIVRFNGELLQHEQDPAVEFFPRMAGLAVQDRAGTTDIEIVCPEGRLLLQYEMIDSMVRMGTEAYIKKHLIQTEDDYRIVETVLERSEFVSRAAAIAEEEARIGDIGFVVPSLCRIPFQQVLLEYVGETQTFFELHDNPERITRLLTLLDEVMTDTIRHLADLDVLYIEFPDNLHGMMTNPRLFSKYCIPAYQRYADILHGQGKKMGSHTDGDLKPLLQLLAESGLDVAESFSPFPLSQVSFEEAWAAWGNGPLIWGGIPSPMLEEGVTDAEFETYLEQLLETIGDRPIILGIGDQALGNDRIDRVHYIAERVENGR